MLLLLAGCPLPEQDMDTGFAPHSDDEDGVDVLMVVDNSTSMEEEQWALARSAELLFEVAQLQVGVTTTTNDYSTSGATSGVDPGEAGLLVGDVMADADALHTRLACDTICWNELELDLDPDFACGDPAPEEATVEYLDCVCGTDEWRTECGSGDEEGIEAAALALCRAVESGELPQECLEYESESSASPIPTSIGDGYDEPNVGLRREGVPTVVVVFTDEGDSSPRVLQGSNDVSPWIELFDELPTDVTFSVVGPPWDGSDASCINGGATWAVERYQAIAAAMGGVYVPLTAGADCAGRDAAEILAELIEAID